MWQVPKSPWFWASLALTAVPVGIAAGLLVVSDSVPAKPALTISASAVLSGALGLLLKSGNYRLAQRKDDREEVGSVRATLAERDEVNSRILQLEKDWPSPDERSPSARRAISDAEQRHAILTAVYQQSRLAATARPGLITAADHSESAPPARREELRQLLRDSALAEPTLDAFGWFLRGSAAYEAGQYTEALAAYDRALALRPDDPNALNNRGIALRNLGRYDEALADYDRALALGPDHPDTLNNRGIALNYLKRHDEALADLDRALALRPDHPDTLNNRGIALNYLKRHDEALADLDRALALRPDDPNALYNRGCVLALTMKPDEAMAAIEAAIAHGYSDCELLANDPDLTLLRSHPVHGPRFATLVDECRARSG